MRRRVATTTLLALLVASTAAAQYFGKNKIRYDTFAWKVYPTPHFRISFYDRSEPSLERVASFAESAYDELARRLNFQILEPVPMIIFATHADFEQTNVIVEFIPEGVGAFAVPARNRMVLPVDLPDADLQHLIQHELTHIFQYEILFQGKLGKALTTRPPQWFMEGMASYLADDEDPRARAVMRDAALSDQVPSVRADVGGYFSYRFGHKVFEFIEDEWGAEGLRDFIFEFRNTIGNPVNRALKRSFDLDAEEFDSRFRAWLRKEYLPLAARRGDPGEFGPAFRVEERVASYEVSPAASPSGDLIAAFSTYKNDVDVVLLGVPDRKLFRNLTKGNTTDYQYLIAQMLTVGPDRGRDLAFGPGGDRVAVFARHERGRQLLVLDAVRGGILARYDVPVDQAMEPAFSPDGTTVAFHAFAHGRGDIYLLDLASGEVRNLTDDEAFDASPVFTPDGGHLVYSSQSAEVAKLFEVDLADPSRRTQLTFGGGNDEGAVFSRDGARLFFASDREDGVLDIYSLELSSRTLTRLTHVIGAAVNPMPVPTPDGERVVYQAYTRGRWRLYVTDPASGTPAGPQPEPAEESAPHPYVPAVSVAVVPEKVEKVKKFHFFVEDVQVLAGFSDNQFISQSYVSLSDQYGDRRFALVFESVAGYNNYQLAYFDLSKRLQWGVTAFDNRSYYYGVDTSTGREERGRRVYRQTGGAFLASYPLSLYHRVDGQVGYIDRAVEYPILTSGGGLTFIPISNRVPFVQLGVTGDTTFWRSYGPHAGRRWTFSGIYASDGFSGTALSKDLTFDGRQYVPLSQRNELALRLFTAASWGSSPDLFYFGGLDTLRGYEYREFVGNRVAFVNIEWRFPLIDHLVFPWLYLNNLRGRVFLDVGAATFDVPGYNPPFRFMKDGRLVDGVSTYGLGFSVNLFGLPMHWDFAKRWDFKETLDRSTRTSFWIGYRF